MIKSEFFLILKVALPMMLSQAFYSLTFSVALPFCGRLGKEKLDSASLAISLHWMLIVTSASGLRWGCLPFFSQTFGGKKPYRAGIYLQKAIFFALLFSIVSVCFILNSGNLLIYVAQQLPFLAVDAELYLIIMIPGSVSLIIYRILVAYTDSMRIVLPTMIIQFFACLLNIFSHYIVMIVLQFDIFGSACCISLTLIFMLIMQILFIRISGIYKLSWNGWNKKSFLKWSKFSKAILPSIGFQLVQSIGLETGSFLAGSLDTASLAAHSIIFQCISYCFLLPIGASSAFVSRISFHLGNNNSQMAKTVFFMCCFVLAIFGIASGILVYILRFEIPKIFSADSSVIQQFEDCIYVVTVYIIIMISVYAFIAGMRATNHHIFAFASTTISYYVFFIPIGVILMYVAHLGLFGLWVGYLCGTSVNMIICGIVMLTIDWNQLTDNIVKEISEETDIEYLSSGEKDNLSSNDPTQPLLYSSTKFFNGKVSTDKHHEINKQIYIKISFVFILVILLALSIVIRIMVPPTVVDMKLENTTISNTTSFTNYTLDL